MFKKYFEKHPLRRIALRHPLYAYEAKRLEKGDLESRMNFHKKTTLKLLRNSLKNRAFPPIRSTSDVVSFLNSNALFTFSYYTFLYVVCRVLKPSVVVETGVGAGISSTFILQALKDNHIGDLYSVDLPKATYTTERGEEIDDSRWIPERFRESGWLIPENLRDRWQLLLGKSEDGLPLLSRKLKRIDLFFHDSEHTYKNMLLEYQTAWHYLAKGGVLASHDVDMNNAFIDFSKTVNHEPVIIREYGFILRKE